MICKKCKKEIADTPFCPMCGAKQSVTHTRRGNGTGSVFKRGNYWVCQVTVGYTPDGKRRYRKKGGFKTKKDAVLFLPELIDGTVVEKTEKKTLKYYYESWLKTDAPKLSESKQCAYRIAWNRLSEIHDEPVSDLSVVRIRDVVGEAATTFYPARDCKSLLSHIFKLAIADQQTTVNLSEYITLPPQKESERIPWNEYELLKMWEAYRSGNRVAAYLLLMTYTGMMPGELFGCTKDMIDLESLQIVGAGLKTDVRKKAPIAIPEFLKPVIEAILAFTDESYPKILKRGRWDFYDDYHAFTKDYGLRDLPMYTCRHTTASALASENVSSALIMEIMRHASFQTTKHYIHVDTATRSEALGSLDPNKNR